MITVGIRKQYIFHKHCGHVTYYPNNKEQSVNALIIIFGYPVTSSRSRRPSPLEFPVSTSLLEEARPRTLPAHLAAFAAVFARLGVGNFPPSNCRRGRVALIRPLSVGSVPWTLGRTDG